MKHRLLQACFLLFFALLAAPLGAQNAPVKVDVNLLRPSVYPNDLAEPGAAIVTITLLDNRPSYRGILNLTLSNNSGQSVTTPLTAELEVNLVSGVPIVLTGSRLAPFVRLLGADAGAGLTDNGIVLAEGEQQFCALVFDPLFLGQPISNQDLNCSFGFAELHEPPTPISPIDEEVAISPLQDAVNFTWLPNYFAGPVINYLTIWDVPREWAGVTPDIIISSLEPIRQPLRVPELNAISKLWTTGDADLIPGHRYLYQIQATDPTGRIRFRNNGYSRPVFFEYTYPTPSTDQLCYEPDELALAGNNGNYQLTWTGYALDSVNHTVSVVTLPERRFVLLSELTTTPTFPTRQLVNGGPQASFRYAIDVDLDTTNRQAYLVTLCTVCALTGEEFCREVVLGTPGEPGPDGDLNPTDSTLVCGLYPAPPLSVAELTATTALTNWELPDDFAGSFVLRWATDHEAVTSQDSTLLSAEQRSYQLTGLSAATDYTFTLCIVCPDGARTCYDRQLTTPAEAIAGCDDWSLNLAATDVGFDQISFTWSAIENVSYAMALAEVGTGPADDFFEVENGAHTLSGFQPLTTYEVILRAPCGGTMFYDTIQVTTTNVGCADAGEYTYDYECGAPGGIDSLDMGTRITHLTPGDTIWAGDFLVQVGEADAVGTQFGGYGFTKIPALGGAKLRLEFRAVEVNENCRMVAGEMAVVSPVRSALEQVRELVAGFNDVMDDLVDILGQVSAVLGVIQDSLNELADNVENQDAINELLDAANEAITQIPFISEDLLQDLEAAEDCIRRATRSGDQAALDACTAQYNAVLAEISAYTEELFNSPFRVDFSAVENQPDTYGFDVQQYASISRPYVTHQIAGTEYKVPWASTALEEPNRGNQFVARRAGGGELTNVFFIDDQEQTIEGWAFNGERSEAAHPGLEARRNKASRHVFAAIPRDTTGGKPPVYLAGQLSIVSYNTEKVTVHLVPVNNAQIAGDQAFLQQRMNEIFHPAVVEITVKVEASLSAPDFSGTLHDIDNHPLSNYTPEMLGLRRLVRQQDYHRAGDYYLLVVEGMEPAGREGFMPRKRHYGFLNAAALGSPEATARIAAHELGHGAWHLQHPFQQFPGAQQGATDNLMDYGGGVGVVRYQWGEVHDPVGNFTLFDEGGEGESQAEGLTEYYLLVTPEHPTEELWEEKKLNSGATYYCTSSSLLNLKIKLEYRGNSVENISMYSWELNGIEIKREADSCSVSTATAGAFTLLIHTNINGVKTQVASLNLEIYKTPYANFESFTNYDGEYGFDTGCTSKNAEGAYPLQPEYASIPLSKRNRSSNACVQLLTTTPLQEIFIEIALSSVNDTMLKDENFELELNTSYPDEYKFSIGGVRSSTLKLKLADFTGKRISIWAKSNSISFLEIPIREWPHIIIKNQLKDTVGLISYYTRSTRPIKLTVVKVKHNNTGFAGDPLTIAGHLNTKAFNQAFIKFDQVTIDTFDITNEFDASFTNSDTSLEKIARLYKTRRGGGNDFYTEAIDREFIIFKTGYTVHKSGDRTKPPIDGLSTIYNYSASFETANLDVIAHELGHSFGLYHHTFETDPDHPGYKLPAASTNNYMDYMLTTEPDKNKRDFWFIHQIKKITPL